MPTAEQTRAISSAVGILYITGTVLGILSAALTTSMSGSDDVLGAVRASDTGLALGALAILAMGAVLAMIPVVAYPVLSKVNALLARGYVLFRSVLEATSYLLAATAWLLLIPLSSSSDVSEVWGHALFDHEGITTASTIMFLIGAAMFYLILYRARLVPRWLAGWGLVAIIPYLIPPFLGLFSEIDVSTTSTTTILLDLPLAVQELTLAVWLIARGFSHRADVND